MKRLILLLLVAAVVLCCAGCSTPEQTTLFCMDTVMDLQIWGKDARQGLSVTAQVLEELENTWSVTDPDSLLNQSMEPDHDLLRQAEKLCERTGGAFDPHLGALSRAWGFYDEQYRVPTQQQITAALAQSGWDLGAALKGYAGDRCVAALEQLHVDRAILNLGGNIQTYGEKADGSPWQVGIQNPNGSNYIGVLSVEGTMAIVTSGDYQRYFEEKGVRYHHILDPQTGYPADSGVRSVTVICRDGLTADALSTALFVMGMEEGTALWRASDDFEAVFILTDGSIHATEGAVLSGCEYEVIGREE